MFGGLPKPAWVSIIHEKDLQILVKAVLLGVTVYYRERRQIRLAKGRDIQGRVQELFKHFPCPLPCSQVTFHLLPQCVAEHKAYCQLEQLTQPLASRIFIGLCHVGLIDWLFTWVISLQVGWPKTPILSHTVGISRLASPHCKTRCVWQPPP